MSLNIFLSKKNINTLSLEIGINVKNDMFNYVETYGLLDTLNKNNNRFRTIYKNKQEVLKKESGSIKSYPKLFGFDPNTTKNQLGNINAVYQDNHYITNDDLRYRNKIPQWRQSMSRRHFDKDYTDGFAVHGVERASLQTSPRNRYGSILKKNKYKSL